MAEITLKAIEQLLDLKLDEKLDAKLDEKLGSIQRTLNQHTIILDGLAKDMKVLKDETTVVAKRSDNIETWGQKVGEKVEIKLEL